MGASGWDYFVSYEADISAALQRLRQDVFARGDYEFGDGLTDSERQAIVEKVRPELDPWLQKCREIPANLEEPFKTLYIQGAEKMKNVLLESGKKPKKKERKPRTIEEALKKQAESGTHSILDILSISPEPEFGAINPFPESKLVEYFESETPSRDKIKEVYESGALEDYICERWQGIYVIAYKNGFPTEIFFAGCSGD